ncbi:hypothetical protein DXG01_002387 [Tephrocybe rancida]|nr:hypothetical protein DXG01_002387 [Tephrocybe rancida]
MPVLPLPLQPDLDTEVQQQELERERTEMRRKFEREFLEGQRSEKEEMEKQRAAEEDRMEKGEGEGEKRDERQKEEREREEKEKRERLEREKAGARIERSRWETEKIEKLEEVHRKELEQEKLNEKEHLEREEEERLEEELERERQEKLSQEIQIRKWSPGLSTPRSHESPYPWASTANSQALNWTFTSKSIIPKSSSSSSSSKLSHFPMMTSFSKTSMASSSASSPKPRSGSMNLTFLTLKYLPHPSTWEEAEWRSKEEELLQQWRAKQEELLQQQQEVLERQQEQFRQEQKQFLQEQQRLEESRQRVDMHKSTREYVASVIERHERQWSALFSIGITLRWESLPWPMFTPPESPNNITLFAVSAYVLSSLLPEELNAKPRKDRIKDLIKKWHPDRFETKCLPRVAEGDREKVKEGMKVVLRLLDDMLTTENTIVHETELAVHPRRMNSETARENEVEEVRDELETRLEGVLRRETLAEARELEIRRMEQVSMGRAEGAKRRLEEAALKREQEAIAREEEAKRREEEAGRREEEVKRKEEEARRIEKEAKRREKEARRIEEEAILKTDHLQQQEDDLKSRERAAKAKEAELELLIAKARESTTLLKLRSIFLDVTAKHYRRLLQCDGRDAQTILDTFQSVSETGLLFIESFSFVDKLLDTDAAAPDRGQLIVAMRRLSAKTQLYPQRYLIDGPMELVDEHPVAGGNFADIYKANFQGNLTCLKVIRVRTAAQVQHLAKVYAREAILWGQLSHPNLLPFYGLHTFRSQIAFVAPWAEKGNLRDYLEKEPNANRVLLCADAAAGVEYLHANGVVHGDLKAANILVDGFGRACLSDFGLSGVADNEIIKWATQSSAASKGGTARWQAPELHDPEIDNIHNSKESDVFAWASTSYEVFTGKRPFFEINSDTKVTLMILRGDVPTRPPVEDKSWTERGLTEKIWMLLKDCWRTQPSERPYMSAVRSRIDNEKPAKDPRSPGQWGSGLAMRFRNAQEANIPDKRPSLEGLDVILSRVMDEPEAGDDGVE